MPANWPVACGPAPVGPLDASTTPVVDDKYSIMEIRDLPLLLLVTGSSRTLVGVPNMAAGNQGALMPHAVQRVQRRAIACGAATSSDAGPASSRWEMFWRGTFAGRRWGMGTDQPGPNESHR